VTVRAVDTSGNIDASPANRAITVAAVVDSVKPDTVVTAPAANASVTAPVTISGTASDDHGVAEVRVAMKNKATGQWWDATTSTFGAYVENRATVTNAGDTNPTWELVTSPPPAAYAVTVRAVDTSGNIDASPVNRPITVAAQVDNTPPTLAVTAPAKNATVATPVTITGTASDDQSVSLVRWSLRDTATNLWWNAATSTWGGFVNNPATLDGSGTSVTWSGTFTGGPGTYWLQAQVVDGGGNAVTPAGYKFTAT
jgi:hypothetical protein